MGEAQAGGETQPALGLIVGVDTTGITLVVGVVNDTLVLQETYVGIVAEFAATTGGAHVVLVTEAIVERFFVPVIRNIVIFTIRVTQLCVRIQLEVGTNEVFSFRNSVYQITQTTVFLVQEVLVSIGIALCNGVTGIQILVVQHGVVGLVVLTGIGDNVVLRDEAGVHTPTAIELHLGVAGLTFLGGDNHNTVCTAVTINGAGGSILKNGHGLYILRVDVGDGAIVRNTVHNVERAVGGTHGTDTTDADRGSTTAGRVAAGGSYLHTRGSTCEGAGNAGGHFFLDDLSFHLGGGTCEGTLGCGTIGHNDGLLQELVVICKDNGDGSAVVHLNLGILITHAVHFQNTIGGNAKGKGTVNVRHGIHRAATLQEHVGTHNSLTGLVFHSTLHSDVLCLGCYRQSQ